MIDGKKSKGFSYRPKKIHAPRLQRLVDATERPKAYFLDKAMERILPELEKQFARELEEYAKTNRAVNSTGADGDLAAEIVGDVLGRQERKPKSKRARRSASTP